MNDLKKVYAARDANTHLFLYRGYPEIKSETEYRTKGEGRVLKQLPSELFPEITFEGGPVELVPAPSKKPINLEANVVPGCGLNDSKISILL